jgi:hypothetical protein
MYTGDRKSFRKSTYYPAGLYRLSPILQESTTPSPDCHALKYTKQDMLYTLAVPKVRQLVAKFSL